jgi:hypothetical protein
VIWDQVLGTIGRQNYPNLNFEYNFPARLWDKFNNYREHPAVDYKNFVCSFNGKPHVGRKLLAAAIKKFGYYHNDYVSKNFSHDVDTLTGHIEDYVGDNINFYSKFFIEPTSAEFFQTVNQFGESMRTGTHIRYNHERNIYILEKKLTESFIHIVSECMPTSYAPFVSEKCLYSIVTRGLFLCYAPPGWHEHLEKYYGFKKYAKLFDYTFDSTENPVVRLVELLTMIGKFSRLSTDDWRDLYLLEQDTIEYNYQHYFSNNYLRYIPRAY